MDFKYLLLCIFILYESASSSPVLRDAESFLDDLEPTEDKIREKRKIDLLQHLETGGVGVKKAALEEDGPEGNALKPEIPPEVKEEEPAAEEEATRAKKQASDNIGSGGKTACGRVISARGPATKLLIRDQPGLYQDGHTLDSKMDRYPSMQSRTFDSLLPVSPLASAVTLTVPATTSLAADTTLAHTLPAIAAPAAVPVAPIAHIEPLSLNLLSHSVPIPALHGMHAMLAHRPLMNIQRVELPKLPEIIYAPAEVKQPAYEVKPVIATRPVATSPYVYPARYGSAGFDGPMICHPYDEKLSQQVIQIRPEVHVIESGTKTLNTSVEEFKSQADDSNEDDAKLREHMRQVNEIREEINQLNRAAQKIVDQQERLADMQQRHFWRAEDKGAYAQYSPFRMYMLPQSYSRANALAYPTSAEDMEFFMNMLKAGKKIGALSETFQPALVSALDATRLVLGGDQGGVQGGGHGSQGGKGPNQEAAKVQSSNGKARVD